MELFLNTLQSIAYIIIEPPLTGILIILGIIFFFKNRKLSFMQSMIVGEKMDGALELTLSQIVMGLVGGIVASIILAYTGIIFTGNSGIEILLLIAIVLMFIKPRFICFSYSGALLGLASIVVNTFNITSSDGTPILKINILMLMSFIGILHIVEAILVSIDGSKGSIPVFSKRDNVIIGGYALKRNWILPMAIFIAYSMASYSGGRDIVATPDWWPLIRDASTGDILKNMVLATFPFFGVIGYGTVTFSYKKEQKARLSGMYILAFGIILTAVAQLARFGIVGELIVVIFAPIAHEAMLKIQSQLDAGKEPIFVSDEKGISVLELVKYSHAYDLGFRVGDKILAIDGESIETEMEVYVALRQLNRKMNVTSLSGEQKEIITKKGESERNGILLVPRMINVEKTVKFEEKSFSRVLEQLRKK